ncbi:hypothetical protein [Cellulosimicrobium cellulans]|uniref:hypothetical protein n=1 Tax=Cellulosimicrobium cellulans TaxID=1710 RepID=UPI0002EEE8FB|nr:hypothetical protein [Cellulosimicrobium cellulans]
MASIDEQRALDHLNLVYRQLHQHDDRLRGAEPPIAEGSSLAQDAQRSTLQPGHRAYFHLRVSYEFLRSIGTLVQATKSFSPLGVEQAMSRSALIAACKALYLLEPTASDDRLSRCAALMLKDDASSLREVDDTLKVLGKDDPMHAIWTSWKTQLEAGPAQVKEQLEALGLAKATLHGDGELFRTAGQYLDAVHPLQQPDGLEPSRSITSEAILVRYWNQTSGYAHANIWPFLRIATPNPDGTGHIVSGRLDDATGLLSITYQVFEGAHELLERRGRQHPPGAAFAAH